MEQTAEMLAAAPESLRVLIVEDSEADAMLLQRDLRKSGFAITSRRVETAAAMREALATEHWNLIISDYSMPTFSGLAALKLLQDTDLDLPFIIVSGAIGEDIAVEAMKAGAHDYIMKGNRARLFPAIRRELREAEERRQRRAGETALLESASRIRSIMDNVADAIFNISPRGCIETCNAVALRMFGYEARELLDQPLALLFPPPDWEELAACLAGFATTAAPRRFGERREIQGLRKGGEQFPMELVVSRMLLERDSSLIIAAHDISDRKQAEQQLRKLSMAVEQSPNMVVITDPLTRIEYSNRRFTELTQFTSAEALGKRADELDLRGLAPEEYERVWTCVRQQGEWKGDIEGRKKSGESFWEHVSVSPIRDAAGGITHYLFVKEDITERKQAAAKIAYMTHYDQLTDLPNKTLFVEKLYQAMETAKASRKMVGVLFLDLDNFKVLNDSFGHGIGDQVLQQVTARLLTCVTDRHIAARESGDEFMILMPDVENVGEIDRLAECVLAVLDAPFAIQGHDLHFGVSIGISVYPLDGDVPAVLLRNADTAMYRAKGEGGNRFEHYAREMNARYLERLSIESALRKAISRGEIVPYYQPQVDLETGRLLGFESLARWIHKERGVMPPDAFISVADESGLIVPISELVLLRSAADTATWNGGQAAPLVVAVNLSARQFKPSLIRLLHRVIAETGIHPGYLELELTEGILMEDTNEAISLMRALKDLGVLLAVDDFGTGYSSLRYLQRLPIDKLKIDRSFVMDLPHNKDDAAIVGAVIALAHKLDLQVIAEGVETESQLAFLRSQECDQAQGYLFGRPLPGQDIPELIRTWRHGRPAADGSRDR
ncbi:MAG: EAL domain-containing protein [Candidatus Schekmanbacteria bacterium]|nr:EAL domain-containing protein [Candidatus Schekmanbacteria bacterium]